MKGEQNLNHWYTVAVVENFKGENFHGLVRSDHFTEKTFVECYNLIIGEYGMPKFHRKNRGWL